ncbi:toxin-antitoxin system YwqK family antitoxin [Fusobacterium sp. IOR10]|uniref:toxin-antitoxin system YwqK family antitoxin n=1 Tax=Fusobacterium sp. IOR10 TaxID=2665157 RepID=UPI0013CF5F7D|nr:hypothetical protein [Fusobacterium sp. IOR10]
MKKILTVLILGMCFMVTGCKDKHPVLENRMINGSVVVYNTNNNKPYTGEYNVTSYNKLNDAYVITEKNSYKKGLKDGACYIYSQDGVLEKKDIYIKGKLLTSNTYYENGQLKIKYALGENGKPMGPFETYYENGQLQSKGTIGELEEKIGIWEYYYENGQLKTKENYNRVEN